MNEVVKEDIYIGVAAHMPYKIINDINYHAIHVGAKGKKTIQGYVRDDSEQDNISEINSSFCELTALYFIWKNIDARYKGLVHYRRYFGRPHLQLNNNPWKKILSSSDLENYLGKADVILPKKRHYIIETNYSHYRNAHKEEALQVTRDAISFLFTDYLQSFDAVMGTRSAHMFNMFIMRDELFDVYSEWLFTILFEVQKNSRVL